jgi:hypothetical protein
MDHHDAEAWVRDCWLPQHLGSQFTARRVQLTWGGMYNCDAVSEDGKVLVAVTTCTGQTATGNNASAKMSKIREDVLFLSGAAAEDRIVVLTDKQMFDRCVTESRNGRMPPEVRFLHAPLAPCGESIDAGT